MTPGVPPQATPPGPSSPLEVPPPEPIRPVSGAEASQWVSLSTQTAAAVDDQVERFIAALLFEDVHGESFKAKLDSAFRLGREEIALAAGLMTGRFIERNMVGLESSPAFQAIQQMREQLDALDPGKAGDLLSQNRILGILPFGSKLKAYFRRFQNASTQLQTSLRQIYSARDDMQRDAVDIAATRAKLWEALQKLQSAARFAEQLDTRLSQKVTALETTDSERAKALEQEVLYYARQNLQDLRTQQAVCVNGYLCLEVLSRTSREMVIGCERVASTGMSALALAQTVARATGNQIVTGFHVGKIVLDIVVNG